MLFPLHPPRAWFDELPDWFTVGEHLTIVTDGDEAGRVAATIAPHDQCILDGQPGCWRPPVSPTAYAAAHQGDTITAEGDLVHTANIGGGVNHARVSARFDEAVKHYDNTASQIMRVRYQDHDGHIIALGALWPDVDDLQLAVARASALSGDWRVHPHSKAWDMTGAQLVNNPGFPLMRRAAGLSGEVYIGGDGGPAAIDDELPERLADVALVAALGGLPGRARGLIDDHCAAIEEAIAAAD